MRQSRCSVFATGRTQKNEKNSRDKRMRKTRMRRNETPYPICIKFRRNHVCKFWLRLVKVSLGGRGLNFPNPRRLSSSPLQDSLYRANVSRVRYRRSRHTPSPFSGLLLILHLDLYFPPKTAILEQNFDGKFFLQSHGKALEKECCYYYYFVVPQVV